MLFFSLRVSFGVFLLVAGGEAFAFDVKLDSEVALLVNGRSGRVLYEKNAHERCYPASLTKVVTALFLLEHEEARLDEEVVIDPEMVGMTPSGSKLRRLRPYLLESGAAHMNLMAGEKIALRELLAGMLVASACDASNAIAKHLEGNIERFMHRLNGYLADLGCANTALNNPHGLFHVDHYTTAYDLGVIARQAMRHPLFRQIVASKQVVSRLGTGKQQMTLVQSNKLLRPGPYYYPHAVGIKTGFTAMAGYALMAAAEKEGRLLIAILLKGKDKNARFRDAKVLFEEAFREPLSTREVVVKGEQPLVYKVEGRDELLKSYVDDSVILSYYPSEEPQVQYSVAWRVPAPPIQAGDIVGVLTVKAEESGFKREVPLKALTPSEVYVGLPWIRICAGVILALFLIGGRYVYKKFRP